MAFSIKRTMLKIVNLDVALRVRRRTVTGNAPPLPYRRTAMKVTKRLHDFAASHMNEMHRAVARRAPLSGPLGWDHTPLNERLAVAALSSVIMSISLGGLAFILFVAYAVLR